MKMNKNIESVQQQMLLKFCEMVEPLVLQDVSKTNNPIVTPEEITEINKKNREVRKEGSKTDTDELQDDEDDPEGDEYHNQRLREIERGQ
jgi:hypothetical protein